MYRANSEKVKCTGQKPNSNLVAALSPSTVSESGHVKVLPTLQIADPTFPNVYACGDVAALAGDGPAPNPNARSAIRQAAIVADNVLLGARRGKEPAYTYRHSWADGLIKLTLGLVRSHLLLPLPPPPPFFAPFPTFL